MFSKQRKETVYEKEICIYWSRFSWLYQRTGKGYPDIWCFQRLWNHADGYQRNTSEICQGWCYAHCGGRKVSCSRSCDNWSQRGFKGCWRCIDHYFAGRCWSLAAWYRNSKEIWSWYLCRRYTRAIWHLSVFAYGTGSTGYHSWCGGALSECHCIELYKPYGNAGQLSANADRS